MEPLRFLVTGVAGFIGGRTAELLLEAGHEVVGVDELNDYYDVSIKKENLEMLSKHGERFSFHHKDICDTEYLREVCLQSPPDIIVHLAARAGVRPSVEEPQLYIHSNVKGTVSILELCREFKVKKLVMASSSSVYGFRDDKEPFREDGDADHPVSPYAATKRSGEMLCHAYHSLFGFPIASLRFFTVYGPRGRPDMAPYKFVDMIYHGKTIQQYGDGSSCRDYTFIDDIAHGVLCAIEKHTTGCEVYNLGKGSTITLLEFIELIENLLGKKAKRNILPDQPGDVPFTQADITKARERLGYDPKTSTAAGMKVFVEWYLKRAADAGRESASAAL
mmetsp:Transcript_15983/g.48033  ORF Transcript_15983/g.48033 Transcript_15983/m.48033 type:complete len:334 (+) Transcript_15983:53-1054(+)|eukprot:CAMPEP_0177650826 /NCGR_PEP_ID=MMETSP0447-20121125/12172_1 /TAXON_ID=0 /ORGANISM="Stygamoeba regulata, Strain BSH-02190019" /LENGTH=333 /DNA_ID=CAMNT_0019153767 /DNA_START=36 /DNA_END=1037 /DNA_ORIENTATION=+